MHIPTSTQIGHGSGTFWTALSLCGVTHDKTLRGFQHLALNNPQVARAEAAQGRYSTELFTDEAVRVIGDHARAERAARRQRQWQQQRQAQAGYTPSADTSANARPNETETANRSSDRSSSNRSSARSGPAPKPLFLYLAHQAVHSGNERTSGMAAAVKPTHYPLKITIRVISLTLN
jgi:hypothetical protein